MRKKAARTDRYFATIEDPAELASAIQDKISIWRKWCEERGLLDLWSKKLSNYYGHAADGSTSQAVTLAGEHNEYRKIKVNDLQNLIRSQLTMVTSQRPAGIAKAINSDTVSLKASKIGTAIAEFYMAQVGFENRFVGAAETALLCDEAFVELAWDKFAGDPIAFDLETNTPEMSGDCIMRTHTPWHVARDVGLKVEQHRWHIVTYRMNRWDAIAMYPKFSDAIRLVGEGNFPDLPMEDDVEDTDAIDVHLLIHDRTPACPDGRYTLLIGDTIVMDSRDENGNVALPYKDYPLERMTPQDVIDGPIGYSASNDVMGLEELTDGIHSIITSNILNFGGQSIVGPEGANLKVTDLGKGCRYFELPLDLVGALRPINFLQTPSEVYGYINTLTQKKEQAVGSNAVVRGNPAEAGMSGASGAALALIQSQAISFNSGIQRSYFALLSAVMTKLIGILRVYADTPRVAKIVGKAKAVGLKEFKYTGNDLSAISSVVYEMVSPIVQTAGGKLTMAQDLLKAGQIKDPSMYIMVATTGNLDTMTQTNEQDQMLILEENEALTEGGRDVNAIITENHQKHVLGHMSVLSSLEAKADPQRVERTLAHINDHIQLAMTASQTNPAILMFTNQQPLPPQAAQQPPPGAPNPQAGAPGGDMGALIGNGEAPATIAAQDVKMPNLPNVAGTNEEAQVPGVNA